MSNDEQIEYWNGEAGQHWADSDAMMERLLGPITESLLAHADLDGCTKALDVGCGGGSQSKRLAQELGEGASVIGMDISGPMLKVARTKAQAQASGRADLEFLQADASSHAFAADSFDLLFSRFGVMFFDDPQAAFTNMRGALRPGAKLAFCCWQAMRDNDWTWKPFLAALKHVPAPEAPAPHAPGPFAFADPERVQSILSGAGFTAIELHSHTVSMQFGESDTLEQAVADLARIGSLSRLLADQPQDIRARVHAELVDAMAPYFSDGALRMPGAVWFVTARVA